MNRVRKEAARKHWDAVASSYTAHKEANRDYFDALKALFQAALPGASRLTVLEVGCGNGDVLRCLNPRYGAGLDVSEAMIDVARRRHADCRNVEFRVGDAEDLAAEELYDAVILPDLLEHVPDWRLALSEAASRVKPGGRLALSTPNPLWAPALYVLETLRLKTPEGPHRFVGLPAITSHLRDLGLSLTSAGNYLLIPKAFGGITRWVNRRCTTVPGIAGLGLIQFATADRPVDGDI